MEKLAIRLLAGVKWTVLVSVILAIWKAGDPVSLGQFVETVCLSGTL